MDKARLLASTFFSLSLVCIAGSVTYFSYALIKTLDEAPALVEQIRNAVKDLDPITKEVENITVVLPGIVSEISLVREQIPLILAEVEALRLQLPTFFSELEKTRETIPSILSEIEQVRLSIPSVVEEVANVRGQIPAIIIESQGYRDLVPDVLAEIEATRVMVSPTMARAEKLVADASVAGQQAGEGAVAGFFSGLIKTPFRMVSTAGNSIFGHLKELSAKDVELLTATARDVINEGELAGSKTWHNKKSNASGSVTLLEEYKKNGQLCRVIGLEGVKDNVALVQEQHTACLSDKGKWEVVTQ